MRSPADADIMVVDITNRCFLACSNCTRAIAHQTSTREMSPEYFTEVLNILQDWYQPGRVVGLIGGEPTLHSRFEEMCQVFREHWNPGQDCTHGREPIHDFNEFAIQRLYDRSNGRGLWTSFGPRFMKHYETVMDTFSHWNPNDHSQGGLHQTGMVDAREMCQALGIPWEKFPHYRDACWVQNTWSAGITPKGNYFCEHAATLDLLYNDGKLAWKNEPGWWKRTPDQFGEQLKICEMCALCLPGPSQVDAKDTDIVSPNHQKRLLQIGSPAAKKGKIEVFDPVQHAERRLVETKDSYVAESGIRVAADNASVRPKSITGIVVAIGCKEIAKTLPHNAAILDKIVVVTNEAMLMWWIKPSKYKNVEVVVVPEDHPAVTEYGFNKGMLLNLGLAAVKNPDWVLFHDADILLNPFLKEAFPAHSWNPGCLYFTNRVENGETYDTSTPVGFFHLWHPSAKVWQGKPVLSEAFCSAGGIDSWFAWQYPKDKWVYLPDLAVEHIYHGDWQHRWNGPPDPRPKWRQWGVIFEGVLQITNPLPDGIRPDKVRLTDTLFGSQWEGDDSELKAMIQNSKSLGTATFLGKDIKDAHIHVAAYY